MSDSLGIPTVVSELEGAGALGAAAISLLAPLFPGTPGTAVSTGTGFVWTKTILSGAEGTAVSLGALGRLKIDSGAISVTIGANWYGPRAEVDILFQLNDGQALTLELNQSVFQAADRVTLPGEAGDLIGYDRSTLGPVEIPLPALALEFSFRPGLGSGIAASLQTYHPGSSSGAGGIFEWTPADNKLLVFRKLFDIAFGVEKLFVDLSATNGVADFKSRFADVYTASWKGIGAQRIDVVVPVEDMFFNASAEGFLVDFDGNFTGDFSLAWQNPTGAVVKAIDAEISLRENQPRRGEVGVTLDLNGVKEAADRPAQDASTTSPSSAETAQVDRAKEEFALRKADLDFDGQVRFSGALTYGVLGGGADPVRTVYGLDLTGAAIQDGQDNTIHAFTGAGAVAVLWTVTALVAVPLFIRGAEEEDASDALIALGMIFLAIVMGAEVLSSDDDGDDEDAGSTTHLPRLDTINLNAIKLRYVHVGVEETVGEGPGAALVHYTQQILELGLDLGAVFSMRCRLTDLIDLLLSLSMNVGSNLIGLFGSTLESAELDGNLELEFGNLFLRFRHTEAHATAGGAVAASFDIFPALDEGLARLLEERSPVVTVRQIPDIKLAESEGATAFPRPVTEIKAVRTGSGEDRKRGVSISFSGLGNASMSVATPAAGVVVYWSPEFSWELMAQLQKDPGFTFLMPPLVYVQGVIDIGKPLPSIGGEQSRIAVDVGIRNTQVPAGKQPLTAEDQRKLRDFKNYEWAFGGEIVWGDATGPNGQEYSFLFVEVHYEGKTPLFTVGPIAVYGLGGLFGHNIAPGIPPGQQSAVGIANWIYGDGKGSFAAVRDWPKDAPTPATWHPDRDFVHDKDRYAFGLFVKAGSAGDGGKNVSVDTILIVGFPEFWLALAGFAVIKKLNAELTVIIVYDHPSRSFVVKAAYNYKVDKSNGRIVEMKNVLEIGSTKTPKRRWFYLGHYADDKGGPGGAKLFTLINTKFYVVYDTQGTDQFGIVLVQNDKVKPPAIPGPLFGFGALYQFGPKTYGPSWLNISLFAGFGFNVAVGANPFLIYGDIYAVGHLQVKVAVFKGKLGFAARLYGLATDNFYRFAGEIEVRINLPWPLDDISESFDFVIEDGVPDFPPPVISTTASALGRAEPRSIELPHAPDARVPIDSVIAIAFNKPIYEAAAATSGNTKLVINDPQAPGNAPAALEKLTTEFADRKYEITLKHVLRYLRIERRPIPALPEPPVDTEDSPGPIPIPPDTGWILVGEVAAAWNPPDDVGDDGAPEPGSEPHHVLYLNTWVAPELQFSQSALEKHYDWTVGWGTIPPCTVSDEVCILEPDGPAVDQSGTFWSLPFATVLGDVQIAELAWNADTYGGMPRNLKRLAWVQGQLDVPEHTGLRFPDADVVDMVLRISALRPANPPLLKRMEVVVAVKLRGLGFASRTKLIARVDSGSPCSFALETAAVVHDDAHLFFGAEVARCLPGWHELAIRLNLVAKEYVHLIDEVTIQGPFFVWDDALLDKPPEQIAEFFSRIQESLVFRLEQVCFRRSLTSRVHWQETELADGGPTGPDALWNNLLLAPSSEYRIRFGVTSFATSRVQNDDADAPNETNEEPAASSESTEELDTVMRTVRFLTEAAPSQDAERYVGLTYPAARDGSAAPYYPDHFRPFFTLKSNGLIQRIYGRHYGAPVLKSEIVDIHGTPLTPEVVDTIELGSSPLDESLEDVVSQCLPDAQHFSWVEIDVWQARLATGRDYAMQLTDLRPGATGPVWSRSFRTSAFASFAAHAAYVTSLFDEAQVLPVVDSGAIRQTLSSLIAAAMAGTSPGRDALVEAIYRDVLGIDGGSLRRHFGVPAEDFAGHVVARHDGGEKLWGMVLELDEPLFGRTGVSLPGLVALDAAARAARGLHLVSQGYLLVVDSAGTRLVVLRSADGDSFTPFEAPVGIELLYAPGEELAALARRYLESVSRPLSPAELAAKLSQLMGTIQGHPDLGVNFAVHAATLAIPLPALEVPPPGGGGDGGGGTGIPPGGKPLGGEKSPQQSGAANPSRRPR